MKKMIFTAMGVLIGLSILIFFTVWLQGYISPRITTDQDIYLSSVIRDEYTISTKIWVNINGDMTLEWLDIKIVNCDQIQQMKESMMLIAEKKIQQVKEKLKTWEPCKY